MSITRRRRRISQAVPLLAALLGATAGCSQFASNEAPPAPSRGGKQVLYDRLSARGRMTLSSTDITPGQPIPDAFTDYGGRQTPSLRWTTPPENAKSLALVVEDPDAPGDQPFVHWVVYGLPTTVNGIGSAGGAALPAGAQTGRNSTGAAGYYGPHPPQGDPPHHYHFELFALDSVPDLPPGADRDNLGAAIDKHVLAKGEMVATYGRP